MSIRKYELLEKNEEGLHRIRALRDIPEICVHKGDLGGLVEHKWNLSQHGRCWVFEDSRSMGCARVDGDALVREHAQVFGSSFIGGHSQVRGGAWVYSNAKISGGAVVECGAQVAGDARVSGRAVVTGYAIVAGNAFVGGNAVVKGSAIIQGNAKIRNMGDYLIFHNWWSDGRFLTWTRSNNMWSVGFFYGTGKELIAKAKDDSAISGREYARVVRYVEEVRKAMKDKEVGK